jgi:hypothetical protein
MLDTEVGGVEFGLSIPMLKHLEDPAKGAVDIEHCSPLMRGPVLR